MPCRLCGSRRIRFGCAWCELTQPSLFQPLSAPEPLDLSALEASQRDAERLAEKRRRRLQELAELGRPVRVALVGCGKAKATVRSTARSLYLGQLFQASLRYALATCDETFILSALHGLTPLDTELEPYHFTMAHLRVVEQESWGVLVAARLTGLLPDLHLEVIGLAGRAYLDPLIGPLRRCRITLTTPLTGLGVGERLAWLKQALAQPNAPASP